MARGSSYGESRPLSPIPDTPQTNIPRRATRSLPAIQQEDDDPETSIAIERDEYPNYDHVVEPKTRIMAPVSSQRGMISAPHRLPELPADYHPLRRHRPWLVAFIVCVVVVVMALGVSISAGIYQRSGESSVVPYKGQTFSIQVGGSYDTFKTWENSNGPVAVTTPLPTHNGPYAVLGKPTISADFINRVLASYHSPAAGKGQALYDLGVKYGIDPVFALAFFMHESLFGTTGVARATLSLGNLRCIPTRPCIDQNIGGFAQMNSWEDGFEQYYKLIRNLYVAKWHLVTVDQIIPVYAPSSDHNDVAGYIAALKHEIDTWHAGNLRP